MSLDRQSLPPPLRRSSPLSSPIYQSPRTSFDKNGDYFTRALTNTPAAPLPDGVTSPIAQRTSPGQLLQTQLSSRHQSSYFSPRRRSAGIHNRNTPSSDNFSTPSPSGLSPSQSWGSAGSVGSCHSSNSGNSLYSYDSSGYLSPSQTQANLEKPPYKPRRRSSDSLTLVRKIRRAKTMPYDSNHKPKRQGKRRKKCQPKQIVMEEFQKRPYWWLPDTRRSRPVSGESCTPVQRRLNDLCSLAPRRKTGNLEAQRQEFARLRSNTAVPLLCRRWSSVEAAGYPIVPGSNLQHSHKAYEISSRTTDKLPPAPSKMMSAPSGSTSQTSNPIGADMLHAIRQKLTSRKFPSTNLKTPVSITLRRASAVRGTAEASDMRSADESVSTGGDQVNETISQPLAKSNAIQNDLDDAYLITREDIDSITELIETNYRRGQQSGIRIDLEPLTLPSTSRTTRSPSVASKGVVPVTGLSATLAIKTAHTQHSSTRQRPLGLPKDGLGRSDSLKSMHEVIWQGGGSPQSASDVTDDEDRKNYNFSSLYSEPTTPLDHPTQGFLQKHATKPQSSDKGVAFDPRNATASISQWSWHSSPSNLLMSSFSDSDLDKQTDGPQLSQSLTSTTKDLKLKKSPTTKLRRQPRTSRSESQLADVVSFPPLPTRKTTDDWYSPLPEIVVASDCRNTRRSLYDIGLDITCGPTGTSSKTITPKVSLVTLAPNSPIQKCPSVDFRPYYDHWSKKMVRPRTAPLLATSTDRIHQQEIHPKASPRTGLSSEIGHSLDMCASGRRTSSTQALKLVRTVDSPGKGSRTGTWCKVRPPSVCPPPRAPSLSEFEDGAVTPQPPPTLGDPIKFNFNMDRTPTLPKMDCAGIYGRMTGSRNKAMAACPQDCDPHVCDDCANDPRSPSVDWIG
ncbi:hypothetical protein G7Y89_g10980 [Cudoniella acicularis]|uniref:Uncharacterized protein n=1 Tax=Cudoniella acicularis TaxID=354080 RepID=A0A8H4VYH0_9HELO|nr:hypothetical protein G7Y89_g10980 [Cudoniella acicularis]